MAANSNVHRQADQRFKALAHYCGVDDKFSPLENEVADAVWQYDEDISMRIEEAQIRHHCERSQLG